MKQLSQLDKQTNQQVELVMVKSYHEQAMTTEIISAIAGLIAAIYFWNPDNQLFLSIWLMFVLSSPLAHYMMLSRFTPTIDHVDWFKTKIQRYQFVSGCIWGTLAVIVIQTGNPMEIAILTAIIAGALVSAVSSSMLRHVYALFAVPVTLLYCLAALTASTSDLKVMGVLGVILLITMLLLSKRLYKELKTSIELRFENNDLLSKLEQANLDKTRFLAAASHDLRQPNQALGLFIESLDYIETAPEKKSIIGKMRQTSEAMSALLNQLLDISRLDANVVPPDIHPIKLQPLLYQITMEHLEQAQEKGLELRLRPTDAVVYADPTLLNRIISNLLSNALRYTKHGGILMAVRKCNTGWRLMVCDTGIGISESDLKVVFHEFRQLNNPERDREKGLGLGLSIVKRLTAIINGTVSVSSRKNRGSCFSITLPVANETDIATLNQVTPPSTTNLEGVKVLIIDDDSAVLDALKTLLIIWKCQVKALTSQDEALQALEHSNWVPDMMLVDYRLRQGQTGVEAIQAISEMLNKDVPALILTGDIAPHRIEAIEKSGFPMLYKPIQADILKQTLMQCLSNL